MQCPTAVRTTESNSKSVEVCRTPRGTDNSGSPNTMGDRSIGGLALPAVPPATVRESTRILTVSGFGGTANLKSPTLRILPRLRGGGCQLSCWLHPGPEWWVCRPRRASGRRGAQDAPSRQPRARTTSKPHHQKSEISG
jgi:hypothetical protein